VISESLALGDTLHCDTICKKWLIAAGMAILPIPNVALGLLYILPAYCGAHRLIGTGKQRRDELSVSRIHL